MHSLFDQIATPLLLDATQEFYGEAVTYRPMRRIGPNSGYEADPDRPVMIGISGAFSELPENVEADNAAYDARADGRLRHVSARLAIEFKLSDLCLAPSPGDRVERHQNGDVFTTGAPRRDGGGGVMMPLNKAI